MRYTKNNSAEALEGNLGIIISYDSTIRLIRVVPSRASLYVTFQMVDVLVSKGSFQQILERIHRLKPAPIGCGW